MKHKGLGILLAMSMALAMTGCGSEGNETTAETTAPANTETTEYIDIMSLPEYDASEFVTIEKYIGVEVPVADKTVTDEEFDDAIKMLLEEFGTVEQIIDRVTEEGDTIVFDFSGAIDGVVFDGGTATEQKTTLGSGGWIDGFEEGLYGKPCGEEFVIDAYFPDNYGKEELNGKTAQFTIKIHYIEGDMILPELNDEFVQNLEGYEVSTVEEFKNVFYADLSEQKASYTEQMAMNELWSILLETARFSGYPENYVEAYTQDMMYSYAYTASMYGMTLEDFAGMYGMDLAGFENMVEEIAQGQVESEMLFHYLADKENIVATEEEYLEVVQGYMDYYGYTDMTKFVADYGVDVVEKQGYADALLENVMEFCYENAVKVPVVEESEEETSFAVE